MRGRRTRGSALVLAIFFMVLLAMLATAYFKLLPSEANATRQEVRRTQAYLVCNSGIQATWAWLRQQEKSGSYPLNGVTPTDISSTDPAWPWRYTLDSTVLRGVTGLRNTDGALDPSWTCTYELLATNATKNGLTPRTFKARVTALLHGSPVLRAEAVLGQTTFAEFGFYSDYVDNSGHYSVFPGDVYEGRFHVNAKLNLNVSASRWTSALPPCFKSRATFSVADAGNAVDGVSYVSSEKPFDGSNNVIAGRYEKMAEMGKAAFSKVDPIEMPRATSSTDYPLAKAAWFGRLDSADNLAGETIPAGLNLNSSSGAVKGGIYIKGDVFSVDLGVRDEVRDAEGLVTEGNPLTTVRLTETGQPTRVIEVKRSTGYTYNETATVRLNGAVVPTPVAVPAGQTAVLRPGSPPVLETFTGQPNGVLFVDGNLGQVPATSDSTNRDDFTADNTGSTASTADDSRGGLSGENVLGKRTIAVNVSNKKVLRIKGDLTRGDTKVGQKATSERDGLGLVAYDVVIGGEIPRLAESDPLYLYSLVFAGRRTSTGTVEPGGVIYENRSTGSTWGRIESFGSYVVGIDRYWGTTSGGSPYRGWHPNFHHDEILANSPTPYYPSRNDYKILSYQEL